MATEESWDLDTDEIRSIDSDELHETRPNRWRGNKSTWRLYTQEERLLYRSMEQLRNRDLSVHLYNAFALKNRPTRGSAGGSGAAATDAEVEDADKTLEEIVDSSDWRPPNLWTAWPMNVRTVPGDDFMKETHDADDEFTITNRRSADTTASQQRQQQQMPSTALEEEVTAAILRHAKERFRRRQQRYREKEAARAAARLNSSSARETTPTAAAAAAAAAASASHSAQSAATSDDEDARESEPRLDLEVDDTDAAGSSPPPPQPTTKQRPRTYEAVVSADDDLSANLLRPSVRHILSTLDKALTVLHNTRLAGLSYMTDSSASATDVSDAASDAGSVSSRASRASSVSVRRGSKGRPRSRAPRTPPPADTAAAAPAAEQRETSQRRGRPRKARVPLPGETKKEMMIRVAREQKKRIPFSSDEEDNNYDDHNHNQMNDNINNDNMDDNKNSNSNKLIKKDSDDGMEEHTGAETSPEKHPRRKRNLPPKERMEARARAQEAALGNWGLRDWSDVIGAASLAGFKPEVVARAAQRCADLFGQGMDMQTLVEAGPASRRGPRAAQRTDVRTRFLPSHLYDNLNNNNNSMNMSIDAHRGAESISSSESDDSTFQHRLAQQQRRRQQRRHGSTSVAASDSDAAAAGAAATTPIHNRSRSRTGSQNRSTSRSSSIGLFLCPVAGCERAVEGFGRRANLQRHVARVHPGQPAATAAAAGSGAGPGLGLDEVESGEEMYGGVHVDGFLRTIRARKGWRTEDAGTRKRKRHYRGRRFGDRERDRDDDDGGGGGGGGLTSEASGMGEEWVGDSS